MEALAGLFEGESIGVSVQWADELGLWVLLESADEVERVVLIRWDHFETAIMEMTLSEPEPIKIIGFDTGNMSK